MSATNTKTKISVGGTELKSFQNLQIRQSIEQHHWFRCQVFTDHIQADGDALALAQGFIGKTFKVVIEPTPDQKKHCPTLENHSFTGLVTSAVAGNHGGQKGQDIITIEGHSATITLDDESNTVAFYKKSLIEIINKTLAPYATLTKSVAIAGGSSPMDYVVQNRENAYQFMKRMCARFGQWFFYDGNKLVVGSIANNGTMALKLHHDLDSYDMKMSVQPSAVQLTQWDYARKDITDTPDLSYKTTDIAYNGGNAYNAKAESTSKNLFTNVAFEKYTDLYQKANTMAENIKKSRVAQMVHLHAQSNNPGIAIAKKLSLQPSDKGAKVPQATFLVIEAHHFVEGNGQYHNSFVAIPAAAAMPYSAIIKPPICEAQSGVVIENNDPSMMGRLKVKLRWHIPPTETPWIRVVVPHGGTNGGMYFLPEKGDEVWVDFEGGDPERPFIVGTVYNKGKGSPTAGNVSSHPSIAKGLKNNDVKAIITRSGHTIELNDEKGEEKIIIKDNFGNEILLDSKKKEIVIQSQEKIIFQSKNVVIQAQDNIIIEGKKKIDIQSKQMVIGSLRGKLKTKSIKINGDAVKTMAKKLNLTGILMMGMKSAFVKQAAGKFVGKILKTYKLKARGKMNVESRDTNIK